MPVIFNKIKYNQQDIMKKISMLSKVILGKYFVQESSIIKSNKEKLN
jgi:hypothetical protein